MAYNPRSNPPRGGHPQRRPDREGAQGIDGIFPGYLEQGYFDGERLRVELLERTRMDRLARAMASGQPPLTSHQVRRFFQHCRRIEARLRASSTWAREERDVLKIDSFAADAASKRKAPPIFEEFIRRNVAAVKDQRDFTEGFMAHFEALLGFGARYFGEREGQR